MYYSYPKRPGPCRVVSHLLQALLLIGVCLDSLALPVSFSEPPPPDSLEVAHHSAYLGIGQAVADFDRDGWPDIYLTSGTGPNTLMRNDRGRLVAATGAGVLELPAHLSAGALFFDYDNDGWTDVTAEAGIDTFGQGQSAAVADFNGDRWLDVYIVHWYFDEDESSELRADQLFLNRGGQFEDVSHWLDEQARSGPGFAAVWFDYNNDGLADLYVANDKLYGNVLWRNDGPGCNGWCFSDVSLETGAARPAFSMGVSTADYDNDGDLDIFYSSIGEQILLENRHAQGGHGFDEVSGVAGASLDATGWGAAFFDADNDGRADLYLATSNADPSRCNRFWRNSGTGIFEDASASSGLDDCGFGMGLATVDLDRDGRVDIVLGNWDQRFKWFRNESQAGRWLRLHLDGADRVNRDAVGSRARLVDSTGRVQLLELQLGSGHGGNHEPVLHFGLGPAEPLLVEVKWPDGVVQRIESPDVNSELRLAHPHAGGLVFVSGFESRQ